MLTLSEPLLRWYDAHKRDLPWRRTNDPYRIWVSEVMLQQTRVDTVIPYYESFLARFPSVRHLARAHLDEVLSMWSGLGYYRRARMLHAAAECIAREHGGVFPDDEASVQRLPGVGRYTAGAILSIAFGKQVALVDGNVERVLSRVARLRGDPRSGQGKARVWKLAASLVPVGRPGDYNQALMELGATVCTPTAPQCAVCPLSRSCEAHARGEELSLPVLPKRRAPKREEHLALVVRKGDKILLGKRKENIVFGGLWEPPRIAEREGTEGFRTLGLTVTRVREVGQIVHTLTHRKLHVRVFSGVVARVARSPRKGEYQEFAYHALGDGVALSTLAKKIVSECA